MPLSNNYNNNNSNKKRISLRPYETIKKRRIHNRCTLYAAREPPKVHKQTRICFLYTAGFIIIIIFRIRFSVLLSDDRDN